MKYWKHIPPLPALLALEAAARHASFSAAAKELNVSQSAVSHAVSSAETFLGAQLFDRTTRPISLTAEGKTYVATLVSCLSQLAAEEKSLRRGRQRHTLTISCNLAYSHFWLFPRLKNFHAAWPDRQVNLVTTYQGLASLDEGIDVAVRFGNGDWPGCTSHLLLKERIVPVATPEYIARTPVVRCPADLKDHVLLHTLSQERSWFDWYQWFDHFDVPLDQGLRGPTFDNHLLMMQAALVAGGVALGWIGTSSELIREGRLVKMLEEPIILDTGLYAVTRNRRDPHVEPFVKWITALAVAEADLMLKPFVGS